MLGFYMKRFLSVSVLLLTFCLVVSAQNSETLTTRARIAKQGTTIDGDRGTFTIPGAGTLNLKQYSFGAAWNNSDRTPKDLDINTLNLHVSYGVFNKMDVSAMFEVQRQIASQNLLQTGFYGNLPFVSTRFEKGVGDSVLSVKYRLQQKKDNIGGIALKGMVKFGSADPAKGLGTGRTDIGAQAIFTSLLPMNVLMNSSMGYLSTTDPNDPVIKTLRKTVQDQMEAGLGVAWPATGLDVGAKLRNGKLQGIFEYSSVTFVGCCGLANSASAKVQNPTDVTAGVRYLLLNRGLTFDAGYRINSRFDKKDPNNGNRDGFAAKIAYTQPNSTSLSPNRGPLVALESDVEAVSANGTAALTATGIDADNDVLSYTWTAAGGQVTGTGARATFRAGAAPGRYTVRVLVSDRKGGTASAEVEITVR